MPNLIIFKVILNKCDFQIGTLILEGVALEQLNCSMIKKLTLI